MAVDIYSPRFMMEVLKTLPPLRTVLKDTFFNQIRTFPTEQVEFDVKKGGMAMAPFVNKRIGSTVLDRQGYSTMTYRAPLVAPKRVMTTDDLDVRLPGEALYSGYNPDRRRAELLQDDLVECDRAITRREEWMCAKVLYEGKIPVVGEGVNEVIEFDFDNKIVVDAAKKWDNPDTATPFDDFNAAADMVGRSGYAANIAIGDKESMRALIRSKQVKENLDIKNFQLGVIAPEVRQNGLTYYGYLPECGLYLYAYNEVYADHDNPNPNYPDVKPGDNGFVPMVYSLIPRGKVLVAPSNMPARMLYGVIKDLKIGSHMEPRVPKYWEQDEPSVRYLKISSRPLPCPMDLDSWVVLDVLG
jgi:hypothetical protein